MHASASFAADTRHAAVMQVSLTLEPGGTERMIIELAHGTRRDYEVSVCCLDHPGAWADELTGAGVEVFSLGRQPGFHPSLGLRIAAEARRRGVGLLHCHHYSPYVYGCLAWLAAPSLRIVMTEHGRLSDSAPPLKRRVITPILTRVPGPMFAVSDDLRRYMISAGFPAGRVGVIPNGIPWRPIPVPDHRAAARRLLGLPPGAPVIGFVGRLDPVKDLGTLINAFRFVQQRISDARLVIIGEGPERPAVEAAVGAAGLRDAVLLTGRRDDVHDLLPGFDLVMNSSISEGVSLTVLEAMAACLPVVATSVGGTPEIVTDGVTGSLVPARNSSELGRAAVELLQAAGLLRAFGAAGRRRFEADFTADRMVERYLHVYAQTLGESAPSRVASDTY